MASQRCVSLSIENIWVFEENVQQKYRTSMGLSQVQHLPVFIIVVESKKQANFSKGTKLLVKAFAPLK